MLVVNLFGGPGTGKSTFAARLFSELKALGINAEYVTEYAKDLVWGAEYAKLSDQLLVTAQQNQKLHRLQGKVDVVVSDSPLLLGLHYATPDYLGGTYATMVQELFATYDNLNLFLVRQKAYQQQGRIHTEAEAIAIDRHIRTTLDQGGLSYAVLPGDMTSIPAARAAVLRLLDIS